LLFQTLTKEAKAALHMQKLDAVADRGYFNGEEILACEQAGITVTLPKPMTSGAKSEGRFGKQDFVYLPAEDAYRCPAGEKLLYQRGKRVRHSTVIGRTRAGARRAERIPYWAASTVVSPELRNASCLFKDHSGTVVRIRTDRLPLVFHSWV
jgi:hypothetical protein